MECGDPHVVRSFEGELPGTIAAIRTTMDPDQAGGTMSWDERREFVRSDRREGGS